MTLLIMTRHNTFVPASTPPPRHPAARPSSLQVYVVPGADKAMEETCGSVPANLNFLSPEALPEAWGAELDAAVLDLGEGQQEFNFLLKRAKCLFVFDTSELPAPPCTPHAAATQVAAVAATRRRIPHVST